MQNVTINGFTYSENTIIIANIDDDGPEYGKITNIFLADDNISFRYIPHEFIGFEPHYFAHKVVARENEKIIRYNSLPTLTHCLIFDKEDEL